MAKKVILFTVLLILLAAGVLQGQVFVGAKKGGNFAFQLGYDPGQLRPGMIVGFCSGVLAAFSLTESLILQPEFLVSQKGRQDYLPSHSEKLYLTCLDFPLLMKLRFLHRPITWSFYTGVQFSITLDGDRIIDTFYYNEHTDLTEDHLTGPDLGIVLGTEVGLPLGSSRIFLDLRYVSGVVPALKHETGRNQVATVFLGYGWEL